MRTLPGSPAAAAGIRGLTETATGDILLGDIVVGINEHVVDDYDDLFNAFDRYNIGDEVTVTLLRERQRVQVKLRLVDVE